MRFHKQNVKYLKTLIIFPNKIIEIKVSMFSTYTLTNGLMHSQMCAYPL